MLRVPVRARAVPVKVDQGGGLQNSLDERRGVEMRDLQALVHLILKNLGRGPQVPMLLPQSLEVMP